MEKFTPRRRTIAELSRRRKQKMKILNRYTGSVILENNLATLRGADLSGADLSGADLSGADLSGADLSDATLRCANLRGADLSDATLSDATLSCATLRGADLSGATLSGADLSGATLRGADLSDATLRGALNGVPKIKNIHKSVYEAASKPNALDMSSWHSCETTHCRAGWVIALTGEAGYAMEHCLGTPAAAALIYMASDSKLEKIPNFYADNESSLADMKRLAELESAHGKS
jgi:uncharacterized protein YjbI with pentapeptide repeats